MKKLIFISHPSGGLSENTRHVERIMQKLYTSKKISDEYCVVAGILNYGHMYSCEESGYLAGLDFCTDLLQRCDLMLLCGDWKTSRGCIAEKEFCDTHNIKYIEVPNENALNDILKYGINVKG